MSVRHPQKCPPVHATRRVRHGALGPASAGQLLGPLFISLWSCLVSADSVTGDTVLDLNDSSITSLHAHDMSVVNVGSGGHLDELILADNSTAHVLSGGSVEDLDTFHESFADIHGDVNHILTANSSRATVGPGADVGVIVALGASRAEITGGTTGAGYFFYHSSGLITGGNLVSLIIDDDSKVELRVVDYSTTITGLTGTWADGSTFEFNLVFADHSSYTDAEYVDGAHYPIILGTVIGTPDTRNRLQITIVKLDTDGDGMSDDYEIANDLDPADPADAALDPDGDGLTNLEESGLGTLARNADSDGDGLPDADEIAAGRNPAVPEALLLQILQGFSTD